MIPKVKFTAVAGLYNELLNQLAEKDIPVFNIKSNNFGFTAICYAQDYKQLAYLGRKYATKIRIIKKYGIYFRIRNLIRRKGLFAGFFISLLLAYIFSHMVWNIEIRTDNIELKNQLAVQLYNENIYPGIFYSKEKFESAGKNVLGQNKDLSYITLNFYHGRLVCEVYGKTEKADYIQDLTENDIYASLSGIISDLRVYEGYSQVELGQSVSQGQLLVSTIFTDKHNRTYTSKTRAYIEAICDKTYTIEIPFHKQTTVLTGEIYKQTALKTACGEISLSASHLQPDAIKKTTMEYATLFGFHLPAVAITDTFYETEEIAIEYDSLTARKIAQLQLENMISNDKKLKKEINRQYEYELYGDSMVVHCHINGYYEIT